MSLCRERSTRQCRSRLQNKMFVFIQIPASVLFHRQTWKAHHAERDGDCCGFRENRSNHFGVIDGGRRLLGDRRLHDVKRLPHVALGATRG